MSRQSHRLPFTGRRIDDHLMSGGDYSYCAEDGTRTTYSSLAPKVGTVIALRARYRCGRCAEVTGVLEDWQVDGQQVVCFTGKSFARSELRDEIVGYTVHTLLTPSYGTPPATMCPKHGPLQVTAEELQREAVRSVDVELRQVQGKATRNIKIPPLDEDWRGILPQSGPNTPD